jgi:hypothetical protein
MMKDQSIIFSILVLSVCCILTAVRAEREETAEIATPPRPTIATSYHATYTGSVENTTSVFTGEEFVDGYHAFAYKSTSVPPGGWETVDLRIWGSPTAHLANNYVYNPTKCTLSLMEYPWTPIFGFISIAKFQKSDVIDGRKCNWWVTVYSSGLRMSGCITEDSIPVRLEYINTSRKYIIITYQPYVPGKQDSSVFDVPSMCKQSE